MFVIHLTTPDEGARYTRTVVRVDRHHEGVCFNGEPLVTRTVAAGSFSSRQAAMAYCRGVIPDLDAEGFTVLHERGK